MKWTTEKRKINDLIPYPKNPRQMTEKQNQDLEDSLKKFDLVEIPAVNKDGTILAGHQRLRVLQALGRGNEEIDVRVPDRLLTEEEIKEYNIRSNKNTGGWDFDKLANDFDISDLLNWGFDEKELNINAPISDDEVPEVSSEPAESVLGEIYQLGRHRLMCGDATMIDDVNKLMGESKADMVFTDPPYNVDYTGKTKDSLKIKNDVQSEDNFKQFLQDSFSNLYIVSKSGASIYICHADTAGGVFRDAFEKAGWKLAQVIIWVKNSMVMGRQDYQWQHEPILYGWKEGEAHLFLGGRSQTTVWQMDRPTSSKEHPTMKPLGLIHRALTNNSKGDDLILDVFGGSGSTLIACEQSGRVCNMMELDPKYCDVIRKRYAKFVGKDKEWKTLTPKI